MQGVAGNETGVSVNTSVVAQNQPCTVGVGGSPRSCPQTSEIQAVKAVIERYVELWRTPGNAEALYAMSSAFAKKMIGQEYSDDIDQLLLYNNLGAALAALRPPKEREQYSIYDLEPVGEKMYLGNVEVTVQGVLKGYYSYYIYWEDEGWRVCECRDNVPEDLKGEWASIKSRIVNK